MRSLSAFATAGLAALALVVGLPGAQATAATASAAASASAASTSTVKTVAATDDVTVSLAPGNNGVVTTAGDLRASVTVHNGTSDNLEAGSVSVFLDRATFSSRSQLESWFDRPDNVTTDVLGSFMTTVDVPAVKAGATATPITVTLPATTLALSGSDWGAKAFGARYSVGGTALTEQHSSVVYYPNDSFEPTSLAMAVPITVPESTTGLISSDALASYTSDNGVLTQELDAVRGRDVALGIDPMILASIRILGNDAPPSAIVWLKRLQTAPNQTFALAYADADLTGLAQAGESTIPRPIDFADAIAAQQKKDPQSYESSTTEQQESPSGAAGDKNGEGTSTTGPIATGDPTATSTPTSIPPTSSVPTTQSLLAFDYTIAGVAWPIEGTVASADLPVLASSGYKTTFLSSANVQGTGSTTENAAVKVGSSTGLVSDAMLSSLIRDASSANTDEQFASEIAELSAELATLTHERPSDSRTLFATVGRNWATTGSRLDDTLQVLSKLAWSKGVGVQTAQGDTAGAATLLSKTASDARVDALSPLVTADTDLDQFATALASPSLITAKPRLRMLALSSTSWSDNPTGLKAEIGKVQAASATTTRLIKVVGGSTINILGDRSSLPIYVQNDTNSPATVYLRVVPSNYNLSVEKNNLPVTIQAKSQQRITVPVQSVANGKVMLTLGLSSKQGVEISTPSQVSINVRAGWETVITLVFGVAVVLLFGGGIYRSLRRRRRGRADTASGQEPTERTS